MRAASKKKSSLVRKYQITPSASAGIKLKASKRRTPLYPKQKLPLERNPLGLLTNNIIRLPRTHRVPPPFNPLGLIMNNNVRVEPYIPTPAS